MRSALVLLRPFDVLHRDGRDLTARPLRDRRARLEDSVAGSELVLPVRRLPLSEAQAWRERYTALPELGGVFAALDQVTAQLAVGRTRG